MPFVFIHILALFREFRAADVGTVREPPPTTALVGESSGAVVSQAWEGVKKQAVMVSQPLFS